MISRIEMQLAIFNAMMMRIFGSPVAYSDTWMRVKNKVDWIIDEQIHDEVNAAILESWGETGGVWDDKFHGKSNPPS